MNRRGFLTGLLASPAVITTPGLLMPVKAWAEPLAVGMRSRFFGDLYVCMASGTVYVSDGFGNLQQYMERRIAHSPRS